MIGCSLDNNCPPKDKESFLRVGVPWHQTTDCINMWHTLKEGFPVFLRSLLLDTRIIISLASDTLNLVEPSLRWSFIFSLTKNYRNETPIDGWVALFVRLVDWISFKSLRPLFYLISLSNSGCNGSFEREEIVLDYLPGCATQMWRDCF